MAKIRLSTQALAGSATEAIIGSGAITTPKITDLAVTTEKIANLAISSVKIADSAVVEAKVADGAIVSGKLANGAVIEAKVAVGAISTTRLADGAVIDIKVATNAAIAETKIAFDTVAGHNHNGTNSRVISLAGNFRKETPAGAINGTNKVFTLSTVPLVGSELLFHNGVTLEIGTASEQYSISANTITMVSAPLSTDSLMAFYWI